jgi:hypothetical protein
LGRDKAAIGDEGKITVAALAANLTLSQKTPLDTEVLARRCRHQTNRYRILQEATEATEGITFPLITLISADWMIRNPRPSAKSAEKSVAELDLWIEADSVLSVSSCKFLFELLKILSACDDLRTMSFKKRQCPMLRITQHSL